MRFTLERLASVAALTLATLLSGAVRAQYAAAPLKDLPKPDASAALRIRVGVPPGRARSCPEYRRRRVQRDSTS